MNVDGELLEAESSDGGWEPASQQFPRPDDDSSHENPQDAQVAEPDPPADDHWKLPKNATPQERNNLIRQIAAEDAEWNRALRTVGGRERVDTERQLRAENERLQAFINERQAAALKQQISQMTAEQIGRAVQTNPEFAQRYAELQRPAQYDPSEIEYRHAAHARFEGAIAEGLPEDVVRELEAAFLPHRANAALIGQISDALNWERNRYFGAPATQQPSPKPAPQPNPKLNAGPDTSNRGTAAGGKAWSQQSIEALMDSDPNEFLRVFPDDQSVLRALTGSARR